MDAIKNRRSIRKFIEKRVEDEKIDLMVRAALQAPTAKNQQANCIYIVRKKENLLKLSEMLPNANMLKTADSALVVLINKNRLQIDVMKSQDAASATTLILLEATHLGIGSCWCGIFPNVEKMNAVKEVLDISDDYIVFSLVALGYPESPGVFHFIDRYDESKVFSD